MVKFRGIDISIVSQFDICKLPEYSMTENHDPFSSSSPPITSDDSRSTASCYVPIYSGSQVWFEYTVDGPHPPTSYLFKLRHNGIDLTSWDCTAKYGYHGKATYHLEYICNDEVTGEPLVKRHAFKFSARESSIVGPSDDCIEISVHRIEHRQRLRVDSSVNAETNVLEDPAAEGFCLVNGGLLEQGRPQRRYRYQLLDAIDEPYAKFRFFYRSYEFLQNHNVVKTASIRSFSTSLSSSDSSAKAETDDDAQNCHTRNSSSSWKSCNSSPQIITTAGPCLTPPSGVIYAAASSPIKTPDSEKRYHGEYSLTPSDSEESLRIITKDSIEDLHSSVRRSPRAQRPDGQLLPGRNAATNIPGSLRKPPMSPTKTKKALTLNLGGAEFDLEKKRRPLSPFTKGGMLRNVFSPVPPSAPAAVTEFGPSVREEVEAHLASEVSKKKVEQAWEKTTRAQRGGRSLMGFLGRRTGELSGGRGRKE